MKKIDYKKDLKAYYNSSAKKSVFVDIPQMSYLMIDGRGNPDKETSYHQAIEALYSLSYTIKFMIKKGPMAIDYGVMPLEGLWWAEDMSAFREDRKDEWLWTMMIMQPEIVTKEMIDDATRQVREKKNPAALDKVRYEKLDEGHSAQIMHVGPFSEEGPTIEKLHAFISENGAELRDKHHEIYLTDIRRAAPERWKTILRQPVTMINKQ